MIDLKDYDVVIMSGIPGSGKSTLKNKYFQADERVTCSADDFFVDAEGNYNFDSSKIGDAHKYCMRHFLDNAEKHGHPYQVIVDNTNIEAWEISPYYAIAEARGLKVCILQVNCSVDIAAKRNTHNVPLKTINRMANRLKNRQLPSHWKVIQIDN